MNPVTPQIANNTKIGFRSSGIDVFFLPMRTGIIKAMPATGRAEIIGNQPAGLQTVYYEISQRSLLSSLKIAHNISYRKPLCQITCISEKTQTKRQAIDFDPARLFVDDVVGFLACVPMVNPGKS